MSKVHRARNPWTGASDFSFEQPDETEFRAVCDDLQHNQHGWAAAGLATRLDVLQNFAQALHAQQSDIVAALIEDTGRERIPHLEFALLIQTIDRVVADAPEALACTNIPTATRVEPVRASSQLVPYGLVLNIAPWNFPLLLSFLDVLPALAAGNSVVIKPSEVTPRWIAPVRAAINAVPQLARVLAILPGDGTLGAQLMERANVVSFTGSVKTGRLVNVVAARLFIPAYLELGGKDPALVLASADLDYAAATILFSATSASGQACQSLEIALVDSIVYNEFVERVVERARRLTINYPDRADGFVGPFILDGQADIVADQLADAVTKGAAVLCGGKLIEHGGRWLEPTVLVNVTPDMKIMREETFGPVLPVMPFESVKEGIALANASSYGLSASVFAATVEEARQVARQLNAGAVNINDASLTSRVHDATHESFNLSGLGRSRFGKEGFLRFVRQKAILENDSGVSVVAS